MGLLAGTKWDRVPHCDRCNLPEPECKCPPPEVPKKPIQKVPLRVAAEKRKHGRIATVIRDLIPDENDLPSILQKLKNSCGAGGSIDDGVMEIQGNHVERVRKQLQDLGYRVKQ